MEAVSGWYTTSDKIVDFIFTVLPFVLPVLLIAAVAWFIDGLIEYGYWLHKEGKEDADK